MSYLIILQCTYSMCKYVNYFLGYYAGRILMAMTAKFLVMNSFDVIFVYMAELFPTSIRYDDICCA